VVDELRVDAALAERTERRQDDARITAAIEHRLATDEARANLRDVEVRTNGGTVTLSGTAPNADAGRRAARIADEVAGVERVVNNVRTAAGDAPARRARPAPKQGSERLDRYGD
jgi:osmotically-inducible protein OsmY